MLFLLKKSICSIVIKKASLLIHWAFVFSADLMTFCSVIEFKKIVEHLSQNFNTVLKGLEVHLPMVKFHVSFLTQPFS